MRLHPVGEHRPRTILRGLVSVLDSGCSQGAVPCTKRHNATFLADDLDTLQNKPYSGVELCDGER